MIGELAAVAASFCFAVAAIIYKTPLMTTSAASASIVRFTGTGLILVVAAILAEGIAGFIDLPFQVLALTAASGIIGLAFGDVLYMTSFKSAGVARTVSVVATYPMFTLVIEYTLGLGTPPIIAAIGALIIFIGIWLLARGTDLENSLYSKKNIQRGVVTALATSILYSVSMLLIAVALDSLPTNSIEGAFVVNSLRTASGGGFLLLSAPLIDRSHGFLRIRKHNIMLLLVGSLVAYGIGWYLLTLGFLLAPASFVVPLSSITPLFASFFAVILLKEPLTKRGMLGVLLTVLGVMTIGIA
jgi:drug/metabolite transporter (DMT)-like permease